MTAIITQPDTVEKLSILSADAQYDLACACGSTQDEHRRRSPDGKWIYPVTLPDGGKGSIFKILLSNVCRNDCKYCPLRHDQDIRRCSLEAEETVRLFWDYYTQGKVFGLFVSSGVIGTPDATMERINAIARILRTRYRFRGYIHLKVIPGASTAAVEEAVRLASAVSLNIEAPGAEFLAKVSDQKDFLRDIIAPIKHISQLVQEPNAFRRRVQQTTQFVVGAAGETDRRIVQYMEGLYHRLKMHRIYFSAYQAGLGAPDLPGEHGDSPADRLTREHRLYQVDFLMRKYGFHDAEIPFDDHNRLPLDKDPKEAWADLHPEQFPVDVNRADRQTLLRVPGLGPLTVRTLLKRRQQARLTTIADIGKPGKLLRKAEKYLTF
ncbi:MAG: radical SAM protein [Phycisphaerae bacterium]|mgnify:CR=1 FL=1|nr:radical SAM protein [Phycisphaerae bacterium]